MRTAFDPDEVSDRDVVPRTPTLAGSTTSLDDSLLQSPYSTRFLSASTSPPTKRSSYPGSRVALESNCKAWWGEGISTDSSNWRASLDLRPLEQLPGHPSREEARPLKSSPSQSDETASITPAPTPNCGRSVSGAKGSPPPDADAEELDAGHDVESHSLCYPRFQRVGTPLVELSQQSISSLPDLSMSPAGQPPLMERGSSEANREDAPSNPPVLRLSITHQSVDSEPLYPPSIDLSPLMNISLDNSSMVAHCDQNSLAPPCASMTQTQCGRSALREAGIAHGSPRALATSPPIENVPNQSHNDGFFQKLIRKTFSLSSFSVSTTGSNSLLTRPTAPIRNQKSQRSWPTRHSTMPSLVQAMTPSSSQEPSAPKRSRWALIQRFVAKPSSAAKAAGANITRRTRAQPRPGGIDHTRRHTIISGHSSSVSFFGDPMVRIDPFARSGGLGATVSPTDAGSSEPLWNGPLRNSGHDTHILGFHARETWNLSRGGGINETQVHSSGLHPPDMPLGMAGASSAILAYPASPVDNKPMSRSMGSLSCYPTMQHIGRRHSAPMLSTLSWSVATSS